MIFEESIDRSCRSHQLNQKRRWFLKFCAVSVFTHLYPRFSFSATRTYLPQKRTLSFFNTHTNESLTAIYCQHGRYLRPSLDDINHILRDHRTGDVRSIDTRLLDLLFRLKIKIRTENPFHIISGYRSYKTNAKLRKNGTGVAKGSFHMSGKAVDVRLPNVSLPFLRDIAGQQRGGGVGYYPRSQFIHLDVGPIRFWTGSA